MRGIERGRDQDRVDSIAWAKEVVADRSTVILDSETTGLEPPVDFVEVALIDTWGRTLLHSLVKPYCEIAEEARRVHGHSSHWLQCMPTFELLHPVLRHILAGKRVVAYNAPFDRMVFREACGHYVLHDNHHEWECAMRRYAAFVGEESSRGGGYRFQKLPGGDHSAVGDCLATLAVIREMANEPGQPLPDVAYGAEEAMS